MFITVLAYEIKFLLKRNLLCVKSFAILHFSEHKSQISSLLKTFILFLEKLKSYRNNPINNSHVNFYTSLRIFLSSYNSTISSLSTKKEFTSRISQLLREREPLVQNDRCSLINLAESRSINGCE